MHKTKRFTFIVRRFIFINYCLTINLNDYTVICYLFSVIYLIICTRWVSR